ncbi:MAG: hypothetical protein A3F41_06110 [Coxiella sp. RIFCSPHIGHO2_12_FULL_44_14]|nr:MAG: hypothetical protein A3F41_06110 [Coxiella sp. RIFCSPHIGHO2_12_FULL_44_14]
MVVTNIAFIPARGGSKRLPRKNILPFLGKPIIGHTVLAALQTQLFDRVVVSTEDTEIAAVVSQWDVEVDQRSHALAGDSVSVVEVCLDFLDRTYKNRLPDTMVVLYATAPLRRAEDIQSVMNLLDEDCHFAMAVSVCHWPVHQVLKNHGDHVVPVFPELIHSKRSQWDRYYLDNGSTYAVHVDAFQREKTFYGHRLKIHEMPRARSIDIDTVEDFEWARYQAERMLL